VSQRASESILVNAEPLAVYKVATDFGHYVDWAADLKKVDVLSTDDQGRALEVAFRAAAFGRSTSYTLRYDYAEAPEVLSWSQTRGDLTTVLNGAYRFAASGTGTKVTYELEVELLVPIPSFVKSRAASRIQSQALRELKARAERLQ
jgi:ribosome-associated toxin RatA of RatAB toxin-antitoxin module